MKFDTSEKGLLTLFRPYQAALMEHLWKINEGDRVGMTSGQALRVPERSSRQQVKGVGDLFP